MQVYKSRFWDLALEPMGPILDNNLLSGACRDGGGRGEPGGTRAMGVCEPGQGGNAAAINNTFMCLGEPPRLTLAPARAAALAASDGTMAGEDSGRTRLFPRLAGRLALPGPPGPAVIRADRRPVCRHDGARPSAPTSRDEERPGLAGDRTLGHRGR